MVNQPASIHRVGAQLRDVVDVGDCVGSQRCLRFDEWHATRAWAFLGYLYLVWYYSSF